MERDDFSFEVDGAGNAPVAKSPKNNGAAVVATPAKEPIRKGEEEADLLEWPVRIRYIEITGYKRLRYLEAEIHEDGTTIWGGDNMQGKSSGLEGLTALFCGAGYICDDPINDELPTAVLKGVVQDAAGRSYTLLREIKPNKKVEGEYVTELVITRADGTEVGRAQEFLKAMTGVAWVDPLKFRSEKDKAAALKPLVGLDTSDLDTQISVLEEQRKLIGRERDRLKGHAKSLPYWEDAPKEEQSATELLAALDAANTTNNEIAARRIKLQQAIAHKAKLESEYRTSRERRESIEAQIEELKVRLQAADTAEGAAGFALEEFTPKLEKFRSEVEALQDTDVTAIAARMTEVETVNRKVRENRERDKAFAEALIEEQKWDAMTAEIRAEEAEKRRRIASVQMPIEGLAFDEDGNNLLYRGRLFDQASKAESLEVCIAIALWKSGKLRVCLVDDGEVLGPRMLAEVNAMVKRLGGQLIMARVSEGPECDLIIESGAVRERKAIAA